MPSPSYAERKHSLAERKLQLLREGEIFRGELLLCRDGVRSHLPGGSFTKGLLGRVAETAYAMVSRPSGLFSIGRLQSLAPLLVTGVSILSKRPVRKTLILGGILIAVVSTATYIGSQRGTRVRKVAATDRQAP